MHEIAIERSSPTRYRAILVSSGEVLCESRTPFFEAARVLQARGLSNDEAICLVHTARPTVVCMTSTVGAAASLTVDEGTGTRFAKWRPFGGIEETL